MFVTGYPFGSAPAYGTSNATYGMKLGSNAFATSAPSRGVPFSAATPGSGTGLFQQPYTAFGPPSNTLGQSFAAFGQPSRTSGGLYGPPFTSFGQPSAGFRQPSAGFRQPSAGFGQPSAGFGQPSASFGQPSVSFGQPSVSFGQPSVSFGQPSASFGQPSASFGQPSASFGQPSASFGQPSASFGQPSASFGQPSASFGQPYTGFRQPCVGFVQPSAGFVQPSAGFVQPSAGFRQPSAAFGPPLYTSGGLFGCGSSAYCGQCGAIAQPTQSSNPFGNTTTPATGTTLPTFGASSFTRSPSGFSVNPIPNGTTIQFCPPVDQDTMMKGGVSYVVGTHHQCITGMKEYENKSLEELRMEDYEANRKGPQKNTSTSHTSEQTGATHSDCLDARPKKNLRRFRPPTGTDVMMKWVPTNVGVRYQCIACMKSYENKSLEELRAEDYVANRKGPPVSKSCSCVTGQTGLFGQPKESADFLPKTEATGFNVTPNGTVIKFIPVTGTDTVLKGGEQLPVSTQHQCITCMKEYENKSLEELRMEDYVANRKGPQMNTGGSCPSGLSGQPTASASAPSCGSPIQSNPVSGTKSGFSAVPNGTPIKFNPPTGTEEAEKEGMGTTVSTKHQCITCMKEYEDWSLEELRVEDYTANRKDNNMSSFGTTGRQLASSTFSVSLGSTTQSKPPFGTTETSKVLSVSVTFVF